MLHVIFLRKHITYCSRHFIHIFSKTLQTFKSNATTLLHSIHTYFYKTITHAGNERCRHCLSLLNTISGRIARTCSTCHRSQHYLSDLLSSHGWPMVLLTVLISFGILIINIRAYKDKRDVVEKADKAIHDSSNLFTSANALISRAQSMEELTRLSYHKVTNTIDQVQSAHTSANESLHQASDLVSNMNQIVDFLAWDTKAFNHVFETSYPTNAKERALIGQALIVEDMILMRTCLTSGGQFYKYPLDTNYVTNLRCSKASKRYETLFAVLNKYRLTQQNRIFTSERTQYVAQVWHPLMNIATNDLFPPQVAAYHVLTEIYEGETMTLGAPLYCDKNNRTNFLSRMYRYFSSNYPSSMPRQ